MEVMMPGMGAPGLGRLCLLMGEKDSCEGLDPLAMAVLPKGARPGHGCSSEPGVCPSNTSPCRVCA